MRLLLILLAALFVTPSVAKPVLTATCSEPVGNRYDLLSGKIEASTDGFSGVTPVFIIDDERPGKLLFIWGAADPAKSQSVERRALEATIISIIPDKVTAVRIGDVPQSAEPLS